MRKGPEGLHREIPAVTLWGSPLFLREGDGKNPRTEGAFRAVVLSPRCTLETPPGGAVNKPSVPESILRDSELIGFNVAQELAFVKAPWEVILPNKDEDHGLENH